ncbi:MAG: OB-fold nucleic acid binding domain-containing protein, partial [Candidatus Saccharimonadales bacterium]
MATIAELRKERLRKLDALKQLGINPYPAHAERTHTLKQASDQFSTLENKPLSVVGRIQGVRKLGKIAFIVIRDQTGQIQLLLSEKSLEGLDPKNAQLGFS